MIGNCNVCHTNSDGLPYAGGRPLQTPFGIIHATNITPDPETGIGAWSEAAFMRAMREGVRRDGAHLYPAFPYDHFTKVTPADLRAVYAFLMTREPVRAQHAAQYAALSVLHAPSDCGLEALLLQAWRAQGRSRA